MKVVLVIFLVLAAFAGGIFAGPALLPKVAEKVGVQMGRPFEVHLKAAEAVVDLEAALEKRDFKAAYQLMGPSYRARVSEARYVAGWEKAAKGAVTGIGAVEACNADQRVLDFGLKLEDGSEIPVHATLEREGDALRFETCNVPAPE
ncbi:MAG TPA: hypothetical protein VHF22_03475 [Planctomycetota bacterium]|nr:hypothetical protein [Planctomycetota bacterium]